jgi:Niemann-Pick C1 protein
MSACMAFLLGSLTRMPAVQTLSIYASSAIFFNFALQLTCFVAFMVIDGERKRANRVDCLPCLKLKKRRDSMDINEPLLEKKQPKRRVLGKLVENVYAPILLHPLSKILIVSFFENTEKLILLGLLFCGNSLLGNKLQHSS